MGLFGSWSDTDITELRSRVGALELQVQHLTRRLAALQGEELPPVPGLQQAPAGEDPRMAQVRELAANGQKIEAIKVTREITGWGLKEAKDFVDRL